MRALAIIFTALNIIAVLLNTYYFIHVGVFDEEHVIHFVLLLALNMAGAILCFLAAIND